jgi:hypothetical protein
LQVSTSNEILGCLPVLYVVDDCLKRILTLPSDSRSAFTEAGPTRAGPSPFLTSHIGLSRSEVQKLLDRVNTTAQAESENFQDDHHAASTPQHSQKQALERRSFNDNDTSDVVAV